MPKLIKLYITSVAFGFGLSAAFLALLLWQDLRKRCPTGLRGEPERLIAQMRAQLNL